MAQSMMKKREVGDYEIGNQIGFGSFSTVWLARHRVSGAEVAIKEIVMERLDKKLRESLKSEIVILRKIDHPNIIRLHDMIEDSGKIYIVLEYCRGGDLSVYIRENRGRIPEPNAKHFLQQLAAGLKILHKNNLIHRDLKPQNLLLSTNDNSSVLKIADFGFARSLQRGLAETLCGSPLYMAPEIMQLQKYDAKADLWSVGAILFQLVTGKTPFTGNSHIQLLQNIVRSTGLRFPPDTKDLSPECIDLCRKLLRPNPVERIAFEEFFNHPFLSQSQPDEISRSMRSSHRVIDGFRISEFNHARNAEQSTQENCSPSNPDDKPEPIALNFGNRQLSEGNVKESLENLDYRLVTSRPKETDSWVLVEKDYVLVSGPPQDSFVSASASKSGYYAFKSSPPTSNVGFDGNSESHGFASRTPLGSIHIVDTLERPSTDCTTRINSLKRIASAITELVNKKTDEKRHLEAFSIQLVILAIWKQALNISRDTRERVSISSDEIEKALLLEVGNAEELAKALKPGVLEMPDAMEMIYEDALDQGKHGAVKEYLGDIENAEVSYSKAVHLLVFLLVEAPTLLLNPPFSLTNSDRNRIQNYIDLLNNRHSISKLQRMVLLEQ